MFTFIRRAWLGQAPLWKVFWFGGPLVGAVLPLALTLLLPASTLWAKALAAAVLVAYGAWACVALWRCAYNVTSRVWGRLARVYVILAFVGVAINVLR
jgi:hypothetical protein